jgi:hypothetical protein
MDAVRRDVQITFHIPCACEHHIVIHSRGAELMAVRDIMQWRAYTSCPFVPCLASAYNFMFSCTSARQVAEQRKLSCSPVLSNCIAFDHRSCMPTVHGHVLGLQLCLSQVSSAASTCHCMPSAHVYPLFMAMCLASLSVAGFYCVKCYVDVTSPGRVIDAALETVDTDTDDIGTHGHSSATPMHPGTLVRKRGVGFKTQTCEIKYR